MSQNQDKEFEDLFKRAAEHFPLDTDSADWDSVLSRLNETDQRKPVAFFKRRNTLLLLLLLLAVGTISSLVTGLIVWNRAEKKNNTTQLKTSAADSINGREKKIADQVYRKVIETLNKPQTATAGNATAEATTKQVSVKPQPATMQRSKLPTTAQQKTPQYKTKAGPVVTADPFALNQPANKPLAATETDTTVVTTPAAVPATVPAAAPEVPATDSTDSTATAPTKGLQQGTKKTATPGSKNFYAGILYASDHSSIGLEPNKGRGFSWQLLAGYRFAKRWSIESGIHIEKKEYYTNGQHTNKDFLNAAGSVLWIESESRLLEIPLTIKYDVLRKNRHNLFATAGLSSYIVNREDFEYEEEVYGVIQKSSVTFTKTTSNLFSTINFSLGYQFRLGKIGSIRIEPYLNLPISGIGKGQSPIISKGIYAGWVYDFRKRKLKQ
ncbi:MAG: outer membrane beta-barrel protein [Sediminibacterium sp.]|nr:outer membrane beta-barrel protein [Sediminibacterium sp.]